MANNRPSQDVGAPTKKRTGPVFMPKLKRRTKAAPVRRTHSPKNAVSHSKHTSAMLTGNSWLRLLVLFIRIPLESIPPTPFLHAWMIQSLFWFSFVCFTHLITHSPRFSYILQQSPRSVAMKPPPHSTPMNTLLPQTSNGTIIQVPPTVTGVQEGVRAMCRSRKRLAVPTETVYMVCTSMNALKDTKRGNSDVTGTALEALNQGRNDGCKLCIFVCRSVMLTFVVFAPWQSTLHLYLNRPKSLIPYCHSQSHRMPWDCLKAKRRRPFESMNRVKFSKSLRKSIGLGSCRYIYVWIQVVMASVALFHHHCCSRHPFNEAMIPTTTITNDETICRSFVLRIPCWGASWRKFPHTTKMTM